MWLFLRGICRKMGVKKVGIRIPSVGFVSERKGFVVRWSKERDSWELGK